MKKRDQFLLLLLANVSVFILACRSLPVLFEDNDDISMAWIASGVYSGTPDCHLEYINAIYGKFLNILYASVPGIEWYTVLFGVLQIIAVTIVQSYVVRLFKDRKVLMALVTAFVYSIWLYIIARLQFTTTAAVLALASMLLLVDRKIISGGFLLVVAGMIRFPAAGLVGLVMAPAFIYYYGTDIRRWLSLSIILCILVGIHQCDNLFYRDGGWKEYREFDSYRGKINDNPNLWRLKESLPEGVDEINYVMVESFFADPEAISSEELSKVVDYLYHGIPLVKRAKNVLPGCWSKYWLWFTIIGVLLIPVFRLKNDRRLAYLVIAGYVLWVVSLSVLSFNCSVKNRVFTSSFMAMAFYPILLVSRLSEESVDKIALWLCSVLCTFGIYEYAYPAITRHVSLMKKTMVIEEQLDLVACHPGYSVVTNGPDFIVEMIPPFALSRSIAPRVFINPYCYMASPLNNDRLPSHLDLLRDDVLMLANAENDDCTTLLKAIEHNYGVMADTVHIAESGDNYLVKIVQRD